MLDQSTKDEINEAIVKWYDRFFLNNVLPKWWWKVLLIVLATTGMYVSLPHLHRPPLGKLLEVVGLGLSLAAGWMLSAGALGALHELKRRTLFVYGKRDRLMEPEGSGWKLKASADAMAVAMFATQWIFMETDERRDEVTQNHYEARSGMLLLVIGFLVQLVGIIVGESALGRI